MGLLAWLIWGCDNSRGRVWPAGLAESHDELPCGKLRGMDPERFKIGAVKGKE
ncbi:MAG: hypothetical protein SWE60_07855 [Thermodesulfobacteriota bacterium]|nr:hypothetical protein [Thermodesulfobacteriota bacterium]